MKLRVRLCGTCGQRPIAMIDVALCFDCWPGGPVASPPCLRCGSTVDYFMSGRCARCHPHAPQGVDSCRDCLAWGATRTTKWLCKACEHWRGHHPVSSCRICRRQVPVTAGACRLCTRQRTLMLQTTGRDLTLREANRYGQQLSFVDMVRRNGTGRRNKPTTRRRVDPVPPVAPVGHRQLVLFDVVHDLHAGMHHAFPPPQHPGMAAHLQRVLGEQADRHGWSKTVRERTLRGVRILLGIQDTPGAPVNASDVDQLATIGIGVPTARQVLDAAGMLHEDRTPVIERWFTHRTTGLPEPMRAELAVWFDVMRHGSTTPPRRRPRAASTIYSQLDFAMPALRAWATDHDSLREISREDFLAILPPAGTPRATPIGGCRSIFQVLKGRRLVFVDPTRGVRGAKAETRLPLPVDVAVLQHLVNSGDVTIAAIAALLAFHGLRSGQVVKLLLTDIHDGRLHLDGRAILLAPIALAKVDAWLDHRARRWPNTANPHLFINYKTAVHTGPIGTWGIGKKLGISAKAIREDRILDEAIATAGDARRISDLFGLSVTQATRYTKVLDPPATTEFEHTRRAGR